MDQPKIQPLGTRVLIKPLEQESKTASGIYIPETAKEKPQMGQVVAVGDAEEINLQVGDQVLFAKYTGTEFRLDGEEFIILEFNDVLARLLNGKQ